MRLICPECGCVASAAAWGNETAAREFAVALARLGEAVGPLLALSYLGLHRPPKRGMAWPKAIRLVEALAEAVECGQLDLGRRSLAVTPLDLRRSLEVVLDRARASDSTIRLPLEGHGYLWKVLAGQVEERESQREAEVEARKRTAPPRLSTNALSTPTPRLPPDELASGFAAVLEKAGLRPARGETP